MNESFPTHRPRKFRATVHGTVFGSRGEHVQELEPGDELGLHVDPLEAEDSTVWVHGKEGALVGHLPDEIGDWLGPWIRGGGVAHATALKVGDEETPSWRRLVIEVECEAVS